MKIVFILTMVCLVATNGHYSDLKTPVLWVDSLPGDFSFSKNSSIHCEAWCYEWAGTNSISAHYKNKDTVICETEMNEATHCSLSLVITKDSCVPCINLVSITPNGRKVYFFKSGYIKIDKTLWKKKIMKADFSFDFTNDENKKRIFWEGKIYKRIK